MAHGMFGSIGEFDGKSMDWPSYEGRFAFFLESNDVPEARRKAVLLATIGETAYTIVEDLNSPTLLSAATITYDSLIKQLRAHFGKKVGSLAARHELFLSRQQDGQTVDEYAAVLRHKAKDCKYGLELDERLRDQLVSGLQSEATRKRLLEKDDWTFTEVCKFASTQERVDRENKLMSKEQSVSEIRPAEQSGKAKSTIRRSNAVQAPQEAAQSFGAWGRSATGIRACYRCGNQDHLANSCPYVLQNLKCRSCGKPGHKSVVCRQSKFQQPANANTYGRNAVHATAPADDDNDTIQTIRLLKVSAENATYKCAVRINGVPVEMELDTGAHVSIVSAAVWERLSRPDLTPASSLHAYLGKEIPTLGMCNVQVQIGEKIQTLPLVFAADSNAAALLGRPWIKVFDMIQVSGNIGQLVKSTTQGKLDALLEEFKDLFDASTVGLIRGYKAHLYFKPDAEFRFNKPRPVPLALRPRVEDELKRLVGLGVLTPVDRAEYSTTPLVIVPKPNGRVRLCGDFKVSLNSQLTSQQYPLPTVNDVLQKLAGGDKFSKIDLADAYLQVELDDESKKYVVLTTHKGLFQVNRLAFGLAPAVAIFQAIMEQILANVPRAMPYLDDNSITGSTDEEHLQNLRLCLTRFREAGIRLQRSKCCFFQSELEHLGHIVSKEGVRPSDRKSEAIRKAPPPVDLTSLESWLAMAQYYSSFIKNFSTIAGPLNALRRKDVPFVWGPAQEAAFIQLKHALSSAPLLVHYDDAKPLGLSTDASAYGVGAVLFHLTKQGEERPVAFASRTLTEAERRYSQIEKEGLAIVFGIKKFEKYLYGRHFQLFTDHQPLVRIFHPETPVPQTALQRIQRWALYLANFDYSIEYRPGKQNFNADAMSRTPLPVTAKLDVEVAAIHAELLDEAPLDASRVKVCSRRDPVISRAIEFTLRGWPQNCTIDETFRPFWLRRDELTVDAGVLLWGTRVIVPEAMRNHVLKTLHESHPGVTRCKQLARSYVWWPKLDKDIELMTAGCTACTEVRRDPDRTVLGQWSYPERRWQRVHIDHAGPFQGHFWFVWIDAYTKFAGAHIVRREDSETTIRLLREIFVNYGLPDEIVSDNGTAFTSDEFQTFLKANGIRHLRSSPYHPQANGEAERFVQTLKKSLKAAHEAKPSKDLELQLQQFLLQYRTTPQATTGRAPAEMLLGYRPTTLLDRLRPSLSTRVIGTQAVQNERRNQIGKFREFQIGTKVYVRFWYGSKRYRLGEVVNRPGPLTYDVQVGDQVHRRHVTQLFLDRCTTTATPERDDESEDANARAAADQFERFTALARSQVTSELPQASESTTAQSSDQPLVPELLTPQPSDQPLITPQESDNLRVPSAPHNNQPTILTDTSERPESKVMRKSKPLPPARELSTRVHKPALRFDDEFCGRGSAKG